MSDIISTTSVAVPVAPVESGAAGAALLPPSRCPVVVRPAAAKDFEFLDALQKMHGHMVGWFPRQQMEAYVSGGHVLIAEHDAQPRLQLGYCIAKDKYMGRDDVGIVYQLNVMQQRQRHLVGAKLIKATFESCARGCKLFSCWCAQDIQANYFWESIGFMPLAFRTGSRGKQRTHIFWQKRVHEGDTTTAYWYPYETKSGAIREDRLVFPIPPDVHWRDAKPIVLPGVHPGAELRAITLPEKKPPRARAHPSARVGMVRARSAHLKGTPEGKAAIITGSGFKYVDRPDYVPEPKPKKPPRAPAQKNDPALVAKTRDLRDRYLEFVNAGKMLPQAHAKYLVHRTSETPDDKPYTLDAPEPKQTPRLNAA